MLDTKRDCVAPKEIVSKLFNLVDHDDAHKKPLSSQYARCPRMAGCSPTAMSQGPDKLSPIRTSVAQQSNANMERYTEPTGTRALEKQTWPDHAGHNGLSSHKYRDLANC